MHNARRVPLLLQELLFIFFCLFPFLVSSQPIYSIIEHEQVDIVIEKWTNKNGLPYTSGASMKKTVQDSRGFMWIYPNNSLIRFDGKHFKEYHLKPNHQGVFKHIVEDSSGNLWLINSEEENSILVFNPRQECFYTIEEYLKSTVYPSSEFLNNRFLKVLSIDKDIFIINDAAGQIWKYDGQLRQVFEEKPMEPQVYLPGPDGLFWKIPYFLEDRDSVLLVNAIGEPLRTFPSSIKNSSFFIDSNYQLWCANYSYDEQSRSFDIQEAVQPVNKEYASAIPTVIYTAHQIAPYWASSSSSAYTLYGSKEKTLLLHQGQLIIDDLWQLLTEAGIFSSSIDYSLKVSPGGSFWMAYNGQLLHIYFREKTFTTLFKGYSIRHISAIEKEQQLLINAYGIPPLLINIQQQKQKYLSFNGLSSLYSGYRNNDDIWFGGVPGGIYQYHYTTGEATFHKLDSLDSRVPFPSETRAFNFVTDSTFLLCSNYGVHAYNPKKKQLQHIVEGTEAYWIHEDQKGDLWAATDKGLYHLSTQQYYLDSLGNSPLSVQHIYEDPDGNFWLSSNQGLVHWKPFGEVYRKISTEDGLGSNNIHAAYPDKRGALWLSTDYGVSAFFPINNRIQNFFDTDGLIGNEQNYLAHYSTPDGRLFFGGINGISAFYPDSIPLYEDSLYHDIYIGTATLFDKDQQSLQQIKQDATGRYHLKVPPACSQVSIDVALPSFDRQQVLFQWRIPGVFNTWNDLQGNQITINGLPAGKHKLALRAYLINAPSIILTKQIAIHQKAFFYNQSWFWVLCMALVVIGSLWLYQWRSGRLILQAKALKKTVDQRTKELREQKEIVENQKNNLEEINQTKNQLFNNINHEFRTPLSLISGYSEQLLTHPDKPDGIRQSALNIKKHTESLAEMIDEILSLQKIDMGEYPLQKNAIDWTELVKQQFNLFNGLAQKKQLIYRLEVVPDQPCVVAINQKKVTSILQNLINNAIKYTPDRGQVIVRTEILEEELLFTVKDNGPGVLKKEQAAIFKRYYQGQAAKGSAQPGYGIGLALSAEYAKLMGSKLWVESQVNKGSTFFFSLPKEEHASTTVTVTEPVPIASLEARAVIKSPNPKSNNEKTAHILVVDDNEELLAFLNDQLSNHYQVTALSNGQLALDFLMQHQDIDLILSDVMMPVMDGKSLLKSVKKEEALAFIPFIMLTALSDLPDKIEAFQLGVDSYLTKPFDLKELFARVANLTHFGQIRKTYRKNKLLSKIPDREQSETHTVAYDEEWMNLFNTLLAKELNRPGLKIAELAYQLHISERTLRSKLIKYTGRNPSQYLNKTRLDLAYSLIKQRKYATVAEVAYATGFKNVRYFSQQFKKEFGKPPSAY